MLFQIYSHFENEKVKCYRITVFNNYISQLSKFSQSKAEGIQGIVSPFATSRKLRRSFCSKFRSSEKGGMIRKEGLVEGCDRT